MILLHTVGPFEYNYLYEEKQRENDNSLFSSLKKK